MSKSQGRCIFCDGSPITGEHVWSEWMSPLLTSAFGDYVVESEGVPLKLPTGKFGMTRRQRARKGEKPGSETISNVCAACNSGWMSQIESASRAVLTPLILGEAHTISPSAQNVIATWLTMKFFVIEGKRSEQQATLSQERQEFKSTRIMPIHLSIWIAPIAAPKWRITYDLFSVGMAVKPASTEVPNVAALIVGFGRFLAYFFYSRFDLRSQPDSLMPALSPILPASSALVWPTMPPVGDAAVQQLADALPSFAQHATSAHAKRQTRLRKVTADPGASKIFKATPPIFAGDEFEDLLCGGCDAVLGESISISRLREIVSVENQLILICGNCSAENFVPVRGTKRKLRNRDSTD